MRDFDEIIDRRGSGCTKWDDMEARFGVPAADGLAMWVADMDFRPPEAVDAALQKLIDHGIYGYPDGNSAYQEAILWWMKNRHGWDIAAESVLSVHGLVNGTALAVDTYTQPGDVVALMMPAYHAFMRVIRAAGREITELPLAIRDGRHVMDWDAWEGCMTGRERMLILCSPHNPGGRVWTEAELRETADFARRHDLILVSDEIHHDLVFPNGAQHHVLAKLVPEIADRLVTLSAATKTFNIAGAHLGNVIIEDEDLRKPFADRLEALGISAGLFSPPMIAAAYSPEGAEWVDALMAYLDGNRQVFDAGVNAVPGLRSMPLEATYLAWVDFSDTGMAPAEFTRRVEQEARIAPNHGADFGTGGESWLRFNLATPRANIETAVERLQKAFADLQ